MTINDKCNDGNLLFECMSYHKSEMIIKPLDVIRINGKYILAIYQGSITEYDILIKYRQKLNDKWSKLRTPKHIHWTVDILIKLYQDEKNTKKFIDMLIELWNKTKPISEKNKIKLKDLLNDNLNNIEKYTELNNNGEYSIKFLILLMKLLMIQEKTNNKDAYMFKDILKKLKTGNKEIFSIISTATHRGK